MSRDIEALAKLVGSNFASLDDGRSIYLTPIGEVRDMDGKLIYPADPGRAKLYKKNKEQAPGGGVTREEFDQLSEEIADLIYVGEDEPTTQSTQIWIDTDDEGDSNVVTSVNGMTGDVELPIPSLDGVATEEYVDDAVSKAAEREGTYELIETITLTEDTTTVDRERTPDGVAYGFDNVGVMIELPAGSYESAAYYAQIYFGSKFISLYQETAPHATAKKRAAFQFETRNGKINGRSIAFASVQGSGDNAYTEGGSVKENGDFNFAEPIKRLRVKSNKTLPAGTEIKIYGAVK